MGEYVRYPEKFSSDKLVLGDHNSLTLYGNDTQQKIIEMSKTLSSLLLNSNDELEQLLHEILIEIDRFQESASQKKKWIFGYSEKNKREHLIKRYNAILVYIDKMELLLKLQEVQLIKDSKIIENLQQTICEIIAKLGDEINYGKNFLFQQELDSNMLEDWYTRLSKKINDLEISRTVAVQNQVQLKLMMKNNEQLIDKIIAALSGILPVWRNQVALILGLEKINRNMEIQQKISELMQKQAKVDCKELKMERKNVSRKIDINKLDHYNNELKMEISSLYEDEKNQEKIRLELTNTI